MGKKNKKKMIAKGSGCIKSRRSFLKMMLYTGAILGVGGGISHLLTDKRSNYPDILPSCTGHRLRGTEIQEGTSDIKEKVEVWKEDDWQQIDVTPTLREIEVYWDLYLDAIIENFKEHREVLLNHYFHEMPLGLRDEESKLLARMPLHRDFFRLYERGGALLVSDNGLILEEYADENDRKVLQLLFRSLEGDGNAWQETLSILDKGAAWWGEAYGNVTGDEGIKKNVVYMREALRKAAKTGPVKALKDEEFSSVIFNLIGPNYSAPDQLLDYVGKFQRNNKEKGLQYLGHFHTHPTGRGPNAVDLGERNFAFGPSFVLAHNITTKNNEIGVHFYKWGEVVCTETL